MRKLIPSKFLSSLIEFSLSDGLGNAHCNRLPQCQLQRLYDCLSTIPRLAPDDPKKYFWLDTICVPHEFMKVASSADDKVFRDQILESMKHITKQACSVLVIDSDILPLQLASSYSEAFVRINFSSWADRAWTLQEAVLAKQLYFQVKYGTTTLKDIMTRPGFSENDYLLGRKYFPAEDLDLYEDLRTSRARFIQTDVSNFGYLLYRLAHRILNITGIQTGRPDTEYPKQIEKALKTRTTSVNTDIELIRNDLLYD